MLAIQSDSTSSFRVKHSLHVKPIDTNRSNTWLNIIKHHQTRPNIMKPHWKISTQPSKYVFTPVSLSSLHIRRFFTLEGLILHRGQTAATAWLMQTIIITQQLVDPARAHRCVSLKFHHGPWNSLKHPRSPFSARYAEKER